MYTCVYRAVQVLEVVLEFEVIDTIKVNKCTIRDCVSNLYVGMRVVEMFSQYIRQG